MNFRLSRVCGLLFFSGASALVYQTAWFRELRLIFGASTSASAAVLAIFMGGLGVGGALLGARADRVKNALAMYANLELLVSIAAALTPLLVLLAQSVYIATGGVGTLGTFGATVVRLLLSVLVLAGPTVLMGGTLPAAARAVTRASDVGRQRVALLYGVNTFGAVAGAVAANFLLVEVFGSRLTLWLACLVNALVGMVARSMARSMGADADANANADADADADAKAKSDDEAGATAVESPHVPWFPPAAAAISGGTFMLMELVWYRMLGPILGGSSYTFGLILAVALAGIGLGGALYARTRIAPTLKIFAVTCAVEALFIAIPYALGDHLATFALLLRPLCGSGFGMSVLAWTLIASVVVLPGAIVSGAQFPMVIGLYGRGARGVGHDVGAAYLANTLGAIAGSIAGGFGLLPALSAPGCWTLVVVLLLAMAGLALALEVRARGRLVLLERGAAAAVGFGLLALFFAVAKGPTAAWRHSGIGAGRADRRLANVTASTVPTFVRLHRGAVLWEEDGLESSVALTTGDGLAFVVNGKTDGHAVKDGPTQVMGGVLGALLHPDPKRAMVIGLGTGSTAGWLGSLPSMDRVDVVELEPAILRIAKDCHAVNHAVLDNPKVHVSLGDAREALLTTREKYDIVFSEPSNPYRAGISSLYTAEFYRAAAERMRPHGLFIQWVQAYEVDAWSVATVIVTLKQVFKEVSVWHPMTGDLLLIAQDDPAVIDAATVRARLQEPAYAAASTAVWRTASLEGVLAHFVANPAMADAMVTYELGAVNHDDQNVLEFAFARGVGHRASVESDLDGFARRVQASAPRVQGPFDPAAVLEERWLDQVANGEPLAPSAAQAPPAARGFGAFLEQHQGGDVRGAFAAWKKLQRASTAYFERRLLADAAPTVDDPVAQAFLDQIDSEGERELLRASRAAGQNDVLGAAAALERGFVLFRTDPWIRSSVASRALELAAELSRTNRDVATKQYEALAQPFAAQVNDEMRRVARAKVGRAIDTKHCADAMHELEPAPFVPNLMQLRLECYEQTSDPRTEAAREDVALLTSWAGSFAGGLTLPSSTSR